MRKMSAVHLLGALRPSGMERMFVSGADAFRDQQIDCIVVGQGSGPHPFRAEIEDAGHRVSVIPRVTSVAGAAEWIRLLRRARPDVVHLHSEATYAPAALLAHLAFPSAAVVRTVHSIFNYQGRRGQLHRLSNLVGDHYSSAVVAPTGEVAANENWRRLPVKVVSNWADRKYADRSEREEPKNSKIALIVGNCSSIKNHEVALTAVLEAGWSVAHIGDEGCASGEEMRLLADLEAQGRMWSRGVMDPLLPMADSAVFMMPSLHEGMGVSLLEALTYGLPALISDAPGLAWASKLSGVRVVKKGEDWADVLDRDVPQAVPRVGTLFSPDTSVAEIRKIYECAVRGGSRSAQIA